MTAIEIILIIIGFICLCASCFVAKKNSGFAEGEKESLSSELWTEKEEEKIKERVGEILSERQDELVDTTEGRMNRLCNDKIMAVDEFSQQILEKIDANHQEVVFMYNMLSEKEKELKEVQEEFEKIKNVALFGIDGGRSDAIMIASINQVDKTIKLISIPRDTYVSVAGHGKTKINHAYAYVSIINILLCIHGYLP